MILKEEEMNIICIVYDVTNRKSVHLSAQIRFQPTHLLAEKLQWNFQLVRIQLFLILQLRT